MLTIIAKITAEPDHGAEIEQGLKALIPPTRTEDGCLQYDLHKSREDPNVFMFVENWKDKASFDAHMNSEHLNHFLKNNESALADLQIYQLEKIQ
jgi:quinol monooxygenase YgiN